jgi:hypothetical protein
VVLTRRGDLDPAAAVFAGDPAPLLLGGDLPDVLAELADRGVGRLLVEGGASVLTALFAAGLVDELRLAVAPVFVGDPAAPRFLGPAGGVLAGVLGALAGGPVRTPHRPDAGAVNGTDACAAAGKAGGRMRLLGVEAVGDMAVLRYAVNADLLD